MGAVGGIDVDQDGADAGDGGLEVDPFGAVGGPHPDAVAGADAQAPEAARGAGNLLLEAAVGEPQPLVAGNQRVSAGVSLGRAIEDLPDGFLDWLKLGTACVAQHLR